MYGLLLLVTVLAALAYFSVSLNSAVAVLVCVSLVLTITKFAAPSVTLLAWLLSALFIVLAYQPLRRQLISDRVLIWFRKVLPSLSKTEQEALDAGTVWWDAELFSGRPNWQRLLSTPSAKLTTEEQAFLDGPVEELCTMLNGWQVENNRDLPADVWQFLKDQGFFSLIIGKEYGGHSFSAQANSAVVMKIASHNITAAITVMVPNSLGPGELLTEFGTEEQKNHYLPRLACGEEIPCFALTAPGAGSDAASMPDRGVVCKAEWNGEETLGLKVSWNKRYITLAPVATVLGLAFRAYDPDHLLGDEEELGITCALIPTNTPGVRTGHRHLPTGSMFMNGPTQGEDVFIPMDYLIGGQARIGQGWRMLMHCLAAGRAISLPALGCSGAKHMARVSGEYARIRKQFGMPIAYFEGVEEVLARMAGNAYRMDAARLLTLAALDQGEKPSVLSAILKYQLTEGHRRCVNDAMDIHGGKGIIQGPNNYLSLTYQTIPIAITVEGANILTRTLIVFGQGAIRNHPYLLREMRAAQADSSEANKNEFDAAFFSHVGFTISNFVRALVMGLTGARLVKAPVDARTSHYYRQLTRLSAAFAFVADVTLLALGGAFKFREKISGRLADVLSHLYMASAVLKHFEDSGRPKEDHALMHWAVRDSLFQIQNALVNSLRNFPIRWVGQVIRLIIFPLGLPYKEPSDTLGKHAARVLLSDNPARDRLIQGLYNSQTDDATGTLHQAFQAVLETAAIDRKLKKALGQALTYENHEALLLQAVADEFVSQEEADALKRAISLTRDAINVDDFEPASVAGVMQRK